MDDAVPSVSTLMLRNLLLKLSRDEFQNREKIKLVKELLYHAIFKGAGAGLELEEFTEKEKIVFSFLKM